MAVCAALDRDWRSRELGLDSISVPGVQGNQARSEREKSPKYHPGIIKA